RNESSPGLQAVACGARDEGRMTAWTSALGPVPLAGGRTSGACGATSATVKEKLSPPAPAIRTVVCTVTRSPASKAVRGFQMVAPSGSATSFPGCTPLRDPVTRTGPRAAGVTPRKLIVVCSVAKWSPGAGETATIGMRASAAGAVAVRAADGITPSARTPVMPASSGLGRILIPRQLIAISPASDLPDKLLNSASGRVTKVVNPGPATRT